MKRAKATKATPKRLPRIDGRGGKPNDISWHERFLVSLGTVPDVTAASKVAGIHPKTAYEHRSKFADFQSKWDEALQEAVDRAEGDLYRRAVTGWEEPVFYQGKLVSKVPRKSDDLLKFYLRAHRPAIYGEKTRIEHTAVRRLMTPEEEALAGDRAEESIMATIRRAALAGLPNRGLVPPPALLIEQLPSVRRIESAS